MNPDWRKLLSGAGIRGSESDLTDEFAARFGFACAQWLAEKLETIITRTTTNTRMRDFYDIAILQQLYGSTLDPHVLHDALLATAHKRGTERHLAEAAEVFDEVENSPVMQDLWAAYQKKFSYASDLDWNTVMAAVRQLFSRCEGEV